MSGDGSRADGSDAIDEVDTADAGRIADHLAAINQVLRDAISAEARRLPVPLTRPQVLVLQVLMEDDSRSDPGLCLSDLSDRVGLAHSTVSGIVARLEANGLVHRSTRTDDRRHIRIRLTDPVRDWRDHDLPALRQRPLVTVLKQVTAETRAALLDGLATLQRLLEDGTAAIR
ncbi:MAG: MarR family winged helix-turn-helix transcriptional regulator [Pseudonocardiaceae bacterium]